jgi:hypothetical protein
MVVVHESSIMQRFSLMMGGDRCRNCDRFVVSHRECALTDMGQLLCD